MKARQIKLLRVKNNKISWQASGRGMVTIRGSSFARQLIRRYLTSLKLDYEICSLFYNGHYRFLWNKLSNSNYKLNVISGPLIRIKLLVMPFTFHIISFII